MDERRMIELLRARLAETGGTVSRAWWQIVLQNFEADSAERIERAGVDWRRDHGLDPDVPFIVGPAAE